MIKFSVAIILLSLASAMAFHIPGSDKFTNWEGRIVGGAPAAPAQFPYQVSLRTAANAHFCGGWIHNTRWVVSAAHCTIGRNNDNTIVVVGAHNRTDGITFPPLTIKIHPGFNANAMTNDIAAIQTSHVITFNNNVQPIPLGHTHIEAGAAIVSGWGQTDHPGTGSDVLMFINTQTLSNEECRTLHTPGNAAFVFNNTICTFTRENEGNCLGDSGSPLVAAGYAIGAVSWGIVCARGFPDVYARVSSHRIWLTEVMDE